MRRFRDEASIVGSCWLLLVGACSSTGKSPSMDAPDATHARADGGTSPIDVPADKSLADLNPVEAGMVCEYVVALRVAAITSISDPRLACVYKALAAPGVVDGMTLNAEACAQALRVCLDETPAPDPSKVARVWSCAPEDLSPFWTSCDIPFGEFRACANAFMEKTTADRPALLARLDCKALLDGIADAGPPSAAASPGTVPECDLVIERCPFLLAGPF